MEKKMKEMEMIKNNVWWRKFVMSSEDSAKLLKESIIWETGWFNYTKRNGKGKQK